MALSPDGEPEAFFQDGGGLGDPTLDDPTLVTFSLDANSAGSGASLGLALKALENAGAGPYSTVISDFPRGPDSSPGMCELWNMAQLQRREPGLQLGMRLTNCNGRDLEGLDHADAIAVIKAARESKQALSLGFMGGVVGGGMDDVLVVQLARVGDTEGLKGLVGRRGDGGEGAAWLVAVRDKQGCSALHHAAACGQHLVLMWLLAQGAAAAATCARGMSALHFAASGGSIECARVLLNALAESGEDDTAWQGFDAAGYLPVHSAAATDNLLVLKFLLERAAALGMDAAAATATATGECSIHVAAARGSLRCVEWLLLLPAAEGGGDRTCVGTGVKNAKSLARQGWRTLFYAAAGGQIETAKLLVARGCDVCHADAAGRSAAVVAAAAAAAAAATVSKLPAAGNGLVGARRAQQLNRRALAAEQRQAGCSLVQAWLCTILRPPPQSLAPTLAHITPTSLAVKWLAMPKTCVGDHRAEAPRVVQELAVKVVRQHAPPVRRNSGVFGRRKDSALSPPVTTSVTSWTMLDSRIDALATSHVIARSHLDFVMPGEIPEDARDLRLLVRVRCGNGNGWGAWSASSDPLPVPGVLGIGRPGAAAPLGLLNLRMVEGSLLPLPVDNTTCFFFVRCSVASPPPPGSSAGDGSGDGALIVDRIPHKSRFRTAFAAGVACASPGTGVACFDPADSEAATAGEQAGLLVEVYEGSMLHVELCAQQRGPAWLAAEAEGSPRHDLWLHGMRTFTQPALTEGRRLPRDDDYDGVTRVGTLTIEAKQLVCGVPAKDSFWPLEQLQSGGHAYMRISSFFLPSAAGDPSLTRSTGLVPGIRHAGGAVCRSATEWHAAERLVAVGDAPAAPASRQVVEFVVMAPDGAGAVDTVTPHGVALHVQVPRSVRPGAPFKVQILQAAAAAAEGDACQVSTADGLLVSAVTPPGQEGGSLFHVCVARDAAPCSASSGSAFPRVCAAHAGQGDAVAVAPAETVTSQDAAADMRLGSDEAAASVAEIQACLRRLLS